MLVIDEGFGTQDTEGRDGLIDAINAVRDDFACILAITHIEELKEAFNVRIEVSKTAEGSEIRVT
jgi:exonuclease SbcC